MNASGVTDLICPYYTRAARLIKQAGIQFDSLPDEKMDSPIGLAQVLQIYSPIPEVLEAALFVQHGR